MKAYRLKQWQREPELEDVAVPEPQHGQVLLKVGGAGACHSDLHLMEWEAGKLPYRLPFTLGHENAGWVEKVGPGVEGFAPGDPVIVYGPWGCGYCKHCRMGMENYCLNAAKLVSMGGGLGSDGGMAEYQLIPSARLLVPLGSLDPREAAPLADAGLTPYHAIKRSLSLLTPGATAVVIGAGGLGQMGIQLLRVLTAARIVAVDTSDEKLQMAREAGADETFRSDDETAARIKDLTQGLGAEVVLDFVGADSTMALAARIARKLGHLTVVGLAGGTIPFSFFALPYECSLAAPYWGTLAELFEVIALAEQGKIKSKIELFPLARVEDAYHALRAGRVHGRAVLVPHETSLPSASSDTGPPAGVPIA
jgi:propanol-preferring alcohol dehydrogenase